LCQEDQNRKLSRCVHIFFFLPLPSRFLSRGVDDSANSSNARRRPPSRGLSAATTTPPVCPPLLFFAAVRKGASPNADIGYLSLSSGCGRTADLTGARSCLVRPASPPPPPGESRALIPSPLENPLFFCSWHLGWIDPCAGDESILMRGRRREDFILIGDGDWEGNFHISEERG
jgi:hypothetical protein